ncbi:thiamine pyrophosphokinase [Rhodobacter viridis]|uniref:Thiamine diphosphokinase n=1 Tax=Rhodobacter viridis TaxID=1054202 RepID=A0A318U2W1_9RHOB|nr:thiamine diphosphokinase [Rhodobacter viridis]PYF10655.1 thiamine pyrophosphokinase [Rhodobacter viridis]
MNEEIVHCEAGVTLLGGGIASAADVAISLTIAPVLVAADGGGDRALALGLTPAAVIGDMDSLSAAGRAALAGRLHPVAEQDSTDFGKCLRLVAARFYLCLGLTGLRLDHTLAALTELTSRPDQIVLLIAEDEVIFRAPPRLCLDLPVGTRVSLHPMGAASGRSTGLRWPIDGLAFAPETRTGTSNEAVGPVELQIDGPMLVLVPKDQLRPVLHALLPPAARGE